MNKPDQAPIHVAFRKFPEGDVIALWGRPDECGMISSYQHVGQHAPASALLIDELHATRASEYCGLREELLRLGYTVLRELELYSINNTDGDTLFCVEADNWEQADSLLTGDMRNHWEFGECHLGFTETHQSYKVYKLPEQTAEAVAHIRRASKEA